MLSATLPKSSAWDLTSKSRFWGHTARWWQCLHEVFHMYRFWSPFVLLREAGLHCCLPQRTERNEGRWTHSSAGGRKDASGKLLVLLPPKSNCTWQIGQAEHGLLHPVGQTGLTALVVAKHRIIKKQRWKGSNNILSTPIPQGTICCLPSQVLKASHDGDVTAFPGNFLHCFFCHCCQEVLFSCQT